MWFSVLLLLFNILGDTPMLLSVAVPDSRFYCVNSTVSMHYNVVRGPLGQTLRLLPAPGCTAMNRSVRSTAGSLGQWFSTAWSLDRHHWHCLETHWKCSVPGPTCPQTHCIRNSEVAAPQSVFIKPPSGADACSRLKSTQGLLSLSANQVLLQYSHTHTFIYRL